MESQHYDTLSATLRQVIPVLALTVTLLSAASGQEAVLITSCDDASLFTAGRTPDDDSFDFAAWEARSFEGAAVAGSSLRWHTHPSSEEQSHARLAWALPLQEVFSELSLWVKNPNNHQLDLRIELIDADGVTYRSEDVELGGELDWRQLFFRTADLEPMQEDPYPPLTFPIVRFSVVVEGLEANRPHTIYLDEIYAHPPEAGELDVERLRLQTALAPGESLPVRTSISPSKIARRARLTAEMRTAQGGLITAAEIDFAEDGEDPVWATAALRVPDWLPSGRYRVALRSDGARLVGDGADGVTIVVGGSRQGLPPVTLSTEDAPAILIGDDRTPARVTELRGAPAVEIGDEALIVAVPVTTDIHPFAWAPPVVDGEDGPDFSKLDRRIAAVLERRNDARILLQVFLGSSPAWDDANPDDLQQFNGNPLGPPELFGGRRTHPDILSSAWRRYATERLRGLIAHVDEAPWRDRVIGYELQAGDLGAWRPWGASAGVGDDRSELRQRLFAAWMRDRYTDVRELRSHWLGRRRGLENPTMGFDAIRMPEPLEDATEPSLYDPAIDQPMIDLQHFRAKAPAEALLALVEAARQAAGPDALIGAPYGHLLSQARSMDWTWPHLALTHCLEAEAFDFLTGPLHRRDDPSLPSSIPESVMAAGVTWFDRELVSNASVTTMTAPDPTPERVDGGAPIVEIVDDLSARYLSGEGDLPRALLTRPISGSIPHRLQLPRDPLGANPRNASIYVFRNLFVIAPDDGRRLSRNVARDGSLLVWVYAPGAVSRHLLTGRTMQYLTGIKLTHLARDGVLRVQPSDRSLGAYGFDAAVSPWFVGADEHAEWLGSLAGTDSDYCGLALRTFEHCSSVFSAAPPTEEVLRHLARITNVSIPTTAEAPEY